LLVFAFFSPRLVLPEILRVNPFDALLLSATTTTTTPTSIRYPKRQGTFEFCVPRVKCSRKSAALR